MNNTNFAKNITPVYFLRNKGDTNYFYNLAGIVKPGSINFIKGSDEVKFTLTDFDHDVLVYYKGALPNNFLEGNTIIATGNITDPDKPNIFVSNKLLTDHSYNSDKWMSKFSYFNLLDRKLQKEAIDESNASQDKDIYDRIMREKMKGFVNMK